MGQSGRALLEALAAGERDPEQLAGLVRTKIRASHAQVVEAVRGRLAAHQRLLLRLYLAQVDALDAAIAAIDHDLGERLAPVQETVQRLTSMPGLSPLSAAVVISEIGLDMSRLYTSVSERHPEAAVIVPPCSTAVPSIATGSEPTQRDRHLQLIAERGRMAWQKAYGYNRRARAETAVSCYKRVIGDGLRSHTDERRATEMDVAVHVLNRMLELGRPTYVRIA